jgi:hypothetical protein
MTRRKDPNSCIDSCIYRVQDVSMTTPRNPRRNPRNIPRSCACGAQLPAYAYDAHAAACPVEQARHAAHVQAITDGTDPFEPQVQAIRAARRG